MRARLAASALCLPAAATAQGACPAEEVMADLDPCLVGNWIGENTAFAAFERAMSQIEGGAAIPGVSPVLGISIYDGGLYITLPFHSSMTGTVTDDDGTTTLAMDLSIHTAVGRVWGDDGILGFCSDTEQPPLIAVEATAPDGATGTWSGAPMGGEDFTPLTTYSCAGDLMTMTVHLPEPLGPVDYIMNRFPDSRFDAEFGRLVAERFEGG
ncbi:hypothetical protein [Histidinibacterium lentulum]|uniref:Uncharacterized protein n=1 Tax=Histidinibacterium lentulum TaxID=2480588 RepID=A0A3N2R586_9RHOB|nr:hypothetical protein [Histidinibacterium lentulum]ROU02531.1 hypothetical protein EAT49_09345 [Histidinibacterium lentulum]